MTEQLRPFEVVDLKSSTALKVMTDLADLKGGDKKLDTVIASNCTAKVFIKNSVKGSNKAD